MMGTLYTISAPSGAGKTSLVHALVQRLPGITVSVSFTTRPRRADEVDGIDYRFVDEAAFRRMVEAGELLEHARVFDHFYGTARQWVMERLEAGQDVILEIDWQGARQVRAAHPDTVGIFILPPSREVLEERLRGRGSDSKSVIDRRMQAAVTEMTHYHEYDYLVVNDGFERAVAELAAILTARALRLEAQVARYEALLEALLARSSPIQ